MKKYRFSSRQHQVIDLSDYRVYFPRGDGATFAVVYGALNHALKNKKSAVMVCGDTKRAPSQFLKKLDEIKKGDWWLSHIAIKSIAKTNSGIMVLLRNGSIIRFASTEALDRGCGIYDLIYVDSKMVSPLQICKRLPSIAKDYCVIDDMPSICDM